MNVPQQPSGNGPIWPTQMPPEPKKKGKKGKVALGIVGGLCVFGLGVGIGSADSATTSMEPAASTLQPTVRETVQVKVPGPTVTVTSKPVVKTKTVTTVPQACLNALDYADQGFEQATKSMQAAATGFQAVSDFDVAALQAQVPVIQETGRKLGEIGPKYVAAKSICRGLAD